ncbi:MAG: hypothetical protein JEZ05_00750 [Tenericutes bacterium]|nr:hypothetical protein [Mycoplasmatota bacterium]
MKKNLGYIVIGAIFFGISMIPKLDTINGLNMVTWTVFGLCVAKVTIAYGLFITNERKKYVYEHFNEEFRVSFAYIFRIILSNKEFLLIKGRNKKYQPVGGVFQYSENTIAYWKKLGFTNDGTGELYDFRGTVKGKNVLKFLKKIKSGKNRENTCYREFDEEIVKNIKTNKQLFDKETLKFEYLKTSYLYGREQFYTQPNRMNIYMVYNVDLSENQDIELLNLVKTSSKFETFKKIQISCLGMDIAVNNHEPTINEHTKYILYEEDI